MFLRIQIPFFEEFPYERGGPEMSMKHIKFRAHFDQQCRPLLNVSLNSMFCPCRTLSHMTDSCHQAMHHKPHFPQITSAFRHSHRGAFRNGAHGDPRLRRHESVMCVGVQSGKTCCSVTHAAPKFRAPSTSKWAMEPQEPLISNPRAHYFSTTVPQMVENTRHKSGSPKF